jgi:large-conductance mechanosensitive channel
MLEVLTASGLALAAGLNAWIPLLVLGALDRFTGLVDLPAGWEWLSNEWVLLILLVLLVVEVVADKVPGLDSLNDIVQTIVRPTAGGLAFGSGVGASTAAVTDPEAFFASPDWIPVAIGVVLALGVHLAKALARPVVNASTAGVGAPVASTLEDVGSVSLSFVAILIPALVLVIVAMMIVLVIVLLRRRREGRRRRDAAPSGP